MATTPHFSLPFRIVGSAAAVNEQDTADEITDCVTAILSYAVGSRIELPEFGLADQAFRENGPDTNAVLQAIARWEPRADPTITGGDVDIEEQASRVLVQVRQRQGSP